MKEIKITRLTLENFKCHEALTLDFMGQSVSIHGDNATGKTSIYDALTWLLFGKDSHGAGEKNIDIKPLTSTGEIKDHAAITAVEAILEVDGVPMSLKRTLREIWSTKRGASEATYDGNTSDYSVDGVPCKLNEFKRRIDEVIDEDTFRLLTGVTFFASEMDWKDRRRTLFHIAGAMTDKNTMATNARFDELSALCGTLTVDDLKKKAAAERKGLIGVRDETPAKLSALMDVQRELSGNDFAAARSELQQLTAEKEGIMRRIAELQQNSAATAKDNEIAGLRLEQKDLDTENAAFRAEQKAKQPDISGIQLEISRLQAEKENCEREIKSQQSRISIFERDIADVRSRWIAANEETFVGGKCPTCGQSLPMDQLKTATDDFDRRKKERLAEIERTANGLKQQKLDAEDRIAVLQEKIEQADAVLANLEKAAAEAKKAAKEPADLPGYTERSEKITAEIARLTAEKERILADGTSVADELRRNLTDINAQISVQNAIIGKEETLASVNERIRLLREEAAEATSRLSQLDKTLWLIEDFIRYKTGFVEDSINSMFRLAKFRLFREQANGGVEERCDVTYDGVPYASLNSGARINIGIDIINAFSRHYGVSVPLFIDNAESVTRLEETDTQVIRLVVDEACKELRCQFDTAH